ncbi:ribbon-helix-helix domain-containing protein [Amorphus sp. 3PC139-8]|uniref:ribbon-helix-helix domain-containing protein n=1 Tax=Amorphus sp. 3PC139-8 TaxID=2735676 RepID=UPI00345D3917
MCRIFADQPPDSYVLETRSMRLNGQGTSIRLERVFWTVLERIADEQGLSLPKFISTLHTEILEIRGEAPNFTSHLRCICMVFLDRRGDALLAFETERDRAAILPAEAAE